jgi:hypothetical protein
MKSFVAQRGERSWIEVIGGRGAFMTFVTLGGYSSYLARLGLKGMGMILIRRLVLFF